MALLPAYYWMNSLEHSSSESPPLIMKTLHSLLALSAVTLLLAVAPVLRAGPPPDYSNRMRPAVSQPAKTETAAKTDKNKIPALCAQMPNCGCATMATKKAKS
jgi:hypothetical protein